MGIDPETNIPNKELPPLPDQLLVIHEFVADQLNEVEPYTDEGDGDGSEVHVREGQVLRLANGSSISCKSYTTVKGESQSYSRVNIDEPNGVDASFYINDGGTFDITASQDGEELYDEADLTPEEALENLDFVGLVGSVYRMITEEVPKPKRVFPRFPLPVAVVLVDNPTEESLGVPPHEVGIAERPVKGQDAALIDKALGLYGVFDGIGGLKGMKSEVAARLTAVTVQKVVTESSATTPEETEAVLVNALQEAHVTVVGWNEDAMAGGTTATVSQVVEFNGENYLVWASVGDTRLYIKTEGKITQLSKDEGEADIITNALGIRGMFNGVKQHGIVKLPSDYELVLCSDGITGDKGDDLLQDAEILQALDESLTAQAAAQNLLEISRKHDDKMVVVVRGQKNAVAA